MKWSEREREKKKEKVRERGREGDTGQPLHGELESLQGSRLGAMASVCESELLRDLVNPVELQSPPSSTCPLAIEPKGIPKDLVSKLSS